MDVEIAGRSGEAGDWIMEGQGRQFNSPEWVVKASTQLPEALKAELEANTNPSTFVSYVRQLGQTLCPTGISCQWR